MNLGGILEHDAREVAGGERTINIPFEPLPAKVGQVAAVVDVGVAEHDAIDRLRVERKCAIALDGFLAFALEESAFEQQPFAVDLEQVHGAGGGARGAEKVDSHARKGNPGRE